jgi:hypothetical protein
MTKLALLILAVLAGAAAPPAPSERPVRVGLAGDDLDACLSDGDVTGLDPRGDKFLALRAAPDARAPILARLRPGQRVHVCEEEGGWFGIVYSPDPAIPPGCGVASPVPHPQPYSGPCASGWVAARYVTIFAG